MVVLSLLCMREKIIIAGAVILYNNGIKWLVCSGKQKGRYCSKPLKPNIEMRSGTH
jgi:hypothetical protein